jgi:ABC-2 type transport system ATP-binding protein
LGYLPENPSFYDYLTARSLLYFVGKVHGLKSSALVKEADRVLALLDLSSAADRPIRSYSKGMVQRLGIAQTLLHDPDLYILDEPMSGLDPMGRALVKDIIRELKRRGKTVFFSTHITADVEAVCDRLGVIVGGKLRVLGDVNSIITGQIESYRVKFMSKSGLSHEVCVNKNKLQAEMENLWNTGSFIERIEPNGQGLEKFFLNVVKKANDEN